MIGRGAGAQQLGEATDPKVLVHGMGGRHAYRVAALRLDAGHPIGGAAEASEKVGAAQVLGYARREAVPLRGRHVGQMTVPPRILDLDARAALGRTRGKAGQVGDDPVAHERPDPDRRVVGAGDRVAHARVDAPDGDAVGQGHGFPELGGLAQQGEESIRFAAGGSHLVHDATGGSGHEVLDLLAQKGEVVGRQGPAVGRRYRLHGRHLDGGRRAHALALGYGRRHEDIRAQGREETAFAAEGDEGSGHVGGPLIVGFPGEEPAGRLVRDDPAIRGKHVERQLGNARRLLGALGQADQAEAPVAAQAHGHERGLAQRPLEDQRARIVGDATHEVEAARSPRDHDLVRDAEKRLRTRPRHDRTTGEEPKEGAHVGQVLIGRGDGAALHAFGTGTGKRPRSRRACCSRGSISRRMSSFA